MSLQKFLASASRELPWRPSFKLRFSEINVLFVTNYWQIETVLYQSNPSSISSDIGRYESPNIASRSRTGSVQVEVQTCHRWTSSGLSTPSAPRFVLGLRCAACRRLSWCSAKSPKGRCSSDCASPTKRRKARTCSRRGCRTTKRSRCGCRRAKESTCWCRGNDEAETVRAIIDFMNRRSNT